MFATALHDAAAKVEARIPDLTDEQVASLEESATLEFDEWFAIGPMFSLASTSGILDLDTAQVLHAWHTDFNDGLSLAKRVVVLQAVGQIMPALKDRGML